MARKPRNPNRRTFLATSAATGLTGVACLLSQRASVADGQKAPFVHTSRRTGGRVILGQDEYQFEFLHDWAKLPEPFTWQTTHNVAVDRDDNLYVIHEGREDQPDHPSIFVFDPAGNFIQAFGHQFQGGGHGLEIRSEGGEQFLYVTAYQQVKAFAKLTLTGETVWHKFAPMEAGGYAPGEAEKPAKVWGRDRFMPTNFAFTPDGGFFLADGYGSWRIHRYDAEGNWLSCFGGEGPGEGTFDTPHGLCVDARGGRDPVLIVADRAHHTLQVFSLDGKYLETISGFGLPANVDSHDDLLVVPELMARLTLLDGKNQVVARLGDDVARIEADKDFAIRGDASRWESGKLVHPHDACFDSQGNLFVAEWVHSGRVSKLRRV